MNAIKQKSEIKKIALWSVMSAVSAITILAVIYALKGISPFGDNFLLRNDAIYQYNPLLVEMAQRIKEGSSLLFSWQSGLGANFFGTMLYYLVNPFNLVSLFFKSENMPIAFSLIVMLSTGLMAFTSSLYLQNHFNKSNFASIAFALCYTFCGFYVSNYYNTMWLMALAMLPLIALGIEKIAKGERPFLYCISLSFAIISNFYLGFMLCIFSVLYFFVCLFSNPINKKDEEREKKETLFPVIFKFGLFSLLSGGISAVSLLPTLYSLGNSYYKSVFEFEGTFFFNIFDFFKSHLSGIVPNQFLVTEKTFPAVTVATIVLVLAILYFFAKKIRLNEKISFAVLLVILIASFEIPALYYAWHGMSAPALMPYRFAFIYSFVLVNLAYRAFVNLKNIPKWAIAVPVVLISAVYIYAFFSLEKEKYSVLIAGIAFMLIFSALIVFLQNLKKGKSIIQATIILLVAAEIISLNHNSFNFNIKKDSYQKYYNEVTEIKSHIKNGNDKLSRMDFYILEDAIMEKITSSRGGMTPSLYGYNGVSQFSSLADKNFSTMQCNLGNSGNSGNAFAYSMQTPVYNSLFNVNYILDTRNYLSDNKHYKKVAQSGGVNAYEAQNMLGLGYMVDEDFLNWDSYDQNSLAVQNSLWKSVSGTENVLTTIKPKNIEYSGCSNVSFDTAKKATAQADVHMHEEGEEHVGGKEKNEESNIFYLMKAAGGSYLYKVEDKNSFSIEFTVVPEKDQMVYFVCNSGMLSNISFEDSNAEPINYSIKEMQKSIISLGFRKAGEEITIKAEANINSEDNAFKLTDKVFDDAIYFTAAGLNDDAFDAGIKNIRENGVFNLTEFNETDLKGTVNAKNDGYMMMSMVYDKGWSVFVDGQKTELQENESNIMMFPVSKGEHQIEMKYFPQGLKEGLFVSAGSVLALFLSVLVIKMRKERFIAEHVDDQTDKKDESDNTKE